MTSSLLSLVYRVRVALLLGAAVCASAGRAEACGEAFHKIAYANPSAVGAGEARTTTRSDDRPPCRGPNCSKAPAHNLPAVPPAPTAPGAQVKELIRSLDPVTADLDPVAPFDRDTHFPRAISLADTIFHPPRLG